MQNLRPSETALKVAYGLLSLSAKKDWRHELPEDVAALTETLILEAKVLGYNKPIVNMSRRRWMVGLYNRFEGVMPGVFQGIGERKLFMQWAVEHALKQGAQQVLIVGAGFDTLCLRLAPKYPDVRFFEIDHPATGIAKARGVAKVGKPPNMELLKVDLGQRALSEVLAETPAWNSEEQSVAVAEGLLYYLPRQAVRELFDHLSSVTGPASQVAFSYMEDHKKHGWVLGMLNALREPWLSSSPQAQLSDYIGPDWQVPATTNPTEYTSGLEEFAFVTKGMD